MKKVGSYNNIPIYEDPNAPLNLMFLINDSFDKSEHPNRDCFIIKLTWWQLFKNRVLKLYLRLKASGGA